MASDPPACGASVSKNSTQVILPGDGVQFDTFGTGFQATADIVGITVNVAGVYVISAFVSCESNATGLPFSINSLPFGGTTTPAGCWSLICAFALGAGEVVSVQYSGGASGSATIQWASLSAWRVGDENAGQADSANVGYLNLAGTPNPGSPIPQFNIPFSWGQISPANGATGGLIVPATLAGCGVTTYYSVLSDANKADQQWSLVSGTTPLPASTVNVSSGDVPLYSSNVNAQLVTTGSTMEVVNEGTAAQTAINGSIVLVVYASGAASALTNATVTTVARLAVGSSITMVNQNFVAHTVESGMITATWIGV